MHRARHDRASIERSLRISSRVNAHVLDRVSLLSRLLLHYFGVVVRVVLMHTFLRERCESERQRRAEMRSDNIELRLARPRVNAEVAFFVVGTGAVLGALPVSSRVQRASVATTLYTFLNMTIDTTIIWI